MITAQEVRNQRQNEAEKLAAQPECFTTLSLSIGVRDDKGRHVVSLNAGTWLCSTCNHSDCCHILATKVIYYVVRKN